MTPGGGPQSTGGRQTVEVGVTGPNGAGVDGVNVDFELTEGPGDADVGSSGDTPESPDLTCTTAGGAKNKAATCTVSYSVQHNVGGSDAILAWIDVDGVDGTVEADTAEGENANAPGDGGCRADSKGPGTQAEPDGTDCVEKRWKARVPSGVDLSPESATAAAGTAIPLNVTVLDQFGDVFAGPGTDTSVAFQLLPGADGSDVALSNGSCDTGTAGSCTVAISSGKTGAHYVCASLAAASAGCLEAVNAPEADNGADVVERSWITAGPPTQQDPPGGSETTVKPHAHGGSGGDASHAEAPAKSTTSPAAPASGTESAYASGAAAVRPADPPSARAVQPADRRHAKPAPAPSQPPHGRRRHARGDADDQDIDIRLMDGSPAGVRGDGPAPDGTAARSRGASTPPPSDGLGRLSRVAATTADRFSFPLSLTVVVVLFLALQSRMDRSDPKLRLAPIDSDHDVVHFV